MSSDNRELVRGGLLSGFINTGKYVLDIVWKGNQPPDDGWTGDVKLGNRRTITARVSMGDWHNGSTQSQIFAHRLKKARDLVHPWFGQEPYLLLSKCVGFDYVYYMFTSDLYYVMDHNMNVSLVPRHPE